MEDEYMYKVTIRIKGEVIKVKVLNTETNEEESQLGHAIVGKPEEYARYMADDIINRFKANKEEIQTIEYVVD
jgi:hypothetical protein